MTALDGVWFGGENCATLAARGDGVHRPTVFGRALGILEVQCTVPSAHSAKASTVPSVRPLRSARFPRRCSIEVGQVHGCRSHSATTAWNHCWNGPEDLSFHVAAWPELPAPAPLSGHDVDVHSGLDPAGPDGAALRGAANHGFSFHLGRAERGIVEDWAIASGLLPV